MIDGPVRLDWVLHAVVTGVGLGEFVGQPPKVFGSPRASVSLMAGALSTVRRTQKSLCLRSPVMIGRPGVVEPQDLRARSEQARRVNYVAQQYATVS